MINETLIRKTKDAKTYSIKGETVSKRVYEIPLNQLKYNLKNGRIASYITEHQEKHGEIAKDYNDTIERYIVQSNKNAFEDTKKNIKRIGQLEPAVVLSNGIVVDGNRRFSALRQLTREGAGGEFAYLKAIILKQENFTDKEIKTFELNLQHGREERVDYNPIEYLIDIYRDLLSNDHQFIPDEYARETNKTSYRIKEDMRIAQLLVDYLEFINRPLQFHFARQFKLDGPLREINKILKSKKIDQDNIPEIKDYLFTSMLASDGDTTRKIRALKPIIEDQYKFEEAYEELEESMDNMYDDLHNIDKDTDTNNSSSRTSQNHSTINISTNIKDKVKSITENTIEKEKLRNAQYEPVESIKRVLDNLEQIDLVAVKKMESADREEFDDYIKYIDDFLDELKSDASVN